MKDVSTNTHVVCVVSQGEWGGEGNCKGTYSPFPWAAAQATLNIVSDTYLLLRVKEFTSF